MLKFIFLSFLSLSLNANQWTFAFSSFPTKQNYLFNIGQGYLSFNFPKYPNEVDYFYTPVGTYSRKVYTPQILSNNISATFSIIGTPVFHLVEPNTYNDPPSVRLFFWSNRNGWGDFDRWWAWDTPVTLTEGTYNISVPIIPEKWVSVWHSGFAYPNEFNKAINDVSSVGFTFGGHLNDYGHGVYISNGNAQFILQEYLIN